jgi:hypothetical protein
MTQYISIIFLVALLPLAASAEDYCYARAKAEQNQILREFSSHPPSKYDQEAYLAWSKKMNAALAAAAQRHEDCAAAARAAFSPATSAKVEECIAESNRRTDELGKRYHGRNLTAQEQATRRAEEQRLVEERISCSSRANRWR